MTTEELLQPRIIIIAPWPQNPINPFHVGDILLKNGIHFTRISNPKSIHEKEIDIYPHLFRKLDWWEERKLEDMPELLMYDDITSGNHGVHNVSWEQVNKGYVTFEKGLSPIRRNNWRLLKQQDYDNQ